MIVVTLKQRGRDVMANAKPSKGTGQTGKAASNPKPVKDLAASEKATAVKGGIIINGRRQP